MRQTIQTSTFASARPAGRLSWGAVFAGVLVALAVHLLLGLLGMGIGFGSIKPMEDANPFSGLGTGTLVWGALSMLISLFAGGWVAGRLSGRSRKWDAVLHGIITWCVFAFLNIYLLTSSVGKIVGGVGQVVGKTLGMAGQGIAAVSGEAGAAIKEQLGIDQDAFKALKEEAELLLYQTEKKELRPGNLEARVERAGQQAGAAGQAALENPQDADRQAGNLLQKLFRSGDEVFAAADRDALVNVIVNRTGKSRPEAEQIVDNWVRTVEDVKVKLAQARDEAEAQARKTGQDIASALSSFSLFAFFGMILGLVSAAWGAATGRDREEAGYYETEEAVTVRRD